MGTFKSGYGRIKSFECDHETLKPGLYVSRTDDFHDQTGSGTITTLDLRFKKPNKESPLDQASIHSIEHLGATYLRNCPGWKDKIVYFGPMGCRTGFYLLLWGKYSTDEIVGLVHKMCRYILSFEGTVPGAKAKECGNYLEHNLDRAKQDIEAFYFNVSCQYK